MKKLMILGAGIYQVPLIRKAKEMGLFTIVVSIPGPYPGFALADKICYLDTRDGEAVLAAAKKYHIDGICTAGTDVAVRTIGYVCKILGLSGIPADAAVTVTDKWRMKEAFLAGSVSTAAFQKVFSVSEARSAAAAFGYPICLKAVDKSGSRGILRVNDPSELPSAFSRCMEVTDRDYLLVEEYIEAPEIGVDGFVSGGHPVLCLPHEKYVYRAGAVCIPGGHHFPLHCTAALRQEIHRQIERAVAATGMDNCPFNADLFIRGDQVFLIEIGGRSGATCIPELISIYCGFDYYEKMIQAALGIIPDFTFHAHTPCMARLLFSETGGHLETILQEPLAYLTQRNVSWHLDYPEGSTIPRVANGTDRIGHVISVTDDDTEGLRDLAVLGSSLVIR